MKREDGSVTRLYALEDPLHVGNIPDPILQVCMAFANFFGVLILLSGKQSFSASGTKSEGGQPVKLRRKGDGLHFLMTKEAPMRSPTKRCQARARQSRVQEAVHTSVYKAERSRNQALLGFKM